jgi:beta-galactosidase
VEVHLNGRLIERKPVTAADLQCIQFTATYEPGVLETIAFRDGAEIARQRLQTVGTATAIRLTPERPTGGSANPVAVGPIQSSTAQTWNGRGLAIVRGRGRAGRVSFEARGEGLKAGTAAIQLG